MQCDQVEEVILITFHVNNEKGRNNYAVAASIPNQKNCFSYHLVVFLMSLLLRIKLCSDIYRFDAFVNHTVHKYVDFWIFSVPTIIYFITFRRDSTSHLYTFLRPRFPTRSEHLSWLSTETLWTSFTRMWNFSTLNYSAQTMMKPVAMTETSE